MDLTGFTAGFEPAFTEGGNVGLTKDDLQSAQKRLQDEKDIVRAELSDLGFTADGKVDVHFDEGFADAAQSTAERAKVLSLAEGLRQRLEDLDEALERIDEGTYGVCERCGNEINPERLDAVPAASLCMPCKQRGN